MSSNVKSPAFQFIYSDDEEEDEEVRAEQLELKISRHLPDHEEDRIMSY